MEATIIWTYKHDGEPGSVSRSGLQSELYRVLEAFWQALDTFPPGAYARVG